MKTKMFLESFFLTLFWILFPFFIFLCFCEVYEQTLSAYGTKVEAFHISSQGISFFGNTLKLKDFSFLIYFFEGIEILFSGMAVLVFRVLKILEEFAVLLLRNLLK